MRNGLLALSTFSIILFSGCSTSSYLLPYDIKQDNKTLTVEKLCTIRGNHYAEMGRAYTAHATEEQKQALRLRLANANTELKRRNPFSKNEWRLIEEKKVQVGMSENALICSWGSPIIINRSSYGSDQYAYDDYRYVYLRGNRVTAWN